MNRPALTALGGSVSLALIVLTGNPAHALIPPANGGSEEAPYSAPVANARTKQIDPGTLGCTCATCTDTARQMIQQGQL